MTSSPVFMQRGTDLNETRSLSLSFKGCSQSFLDFPLEENSFYLSSLKLHSELRTLPPFVTQLGSITELCLVSPTKLSEDVLSALSSISTLHYLKLIARKLGKFFVQQGALGTLRRLCIEVQSITSLENQEGALPQLESLYLLCKDMDGLCGATIGRLGRLREIALDDGVSEETKKKWKEEAKMHPRQPRVSLLKTKQVGEAKAGGVSLNPVASTPEAAIPVQPNREPEPSAMHEKTLLGGLFSKKTNVMTSTEIST